MPGVSGGAVPTLSPPLNSSMCDTGDPAGLLIPNFCAHQLPPVRHSTNTDLLRGAERDAQQELNSLPSQNILCVTSGSAREGRWHRAELAEAGDAAASSPWHQGIFKPA